MNTGSETRARRFPSNCDMVLRLALPLKNPRRIWPPIAALRLFLARLAPRSAAPALLTLLLLADMPVAAQFGSPFPGAGGGGYPGTGYPGGGGGGIQLPGRRRNGQSNQPTDSFSGKIQRLSTSQLVLDPGDGRNITISLERNTRYISDSGGNGRYGDFDAGDEVSVDASHDNQNFYHAVRVSLLKKGTPGDVSESRSGNSSANDDPDKPVLKRAGSASRGDSAASSAKPAAADDDPDRPRLTRSGSGANSSGTTSSATATSDSAPTQRPIRAQITNPDADQSVTVSRRPTSSAPPVPVAREADDPGPPVLRRGSVRVDRTPPAGSEPEVVASARPSIRAEDSNGVTRLPPPPVVGPPDAGDSSDHTSSVRAAMAGATAGDPVIQSAREAAWHFSETLPNYVVKQFTTRYQTDTAKGNRTSWQALDVVTADVIAEGGKESYKNILVNGKVPRDSVEKTGSWSTGEFVTIQLNLLAPQTDADFHNKRSTTIVNRAAFKYDFSVEQPNSNWDIHASAESYKPGYTGTIWIDKENFRVLRIEMSAKNMPRAFPLDAVESALDYDYVLIGDQKFLLPAHSEALSCIRGTAECTRNVIDFRNYRKFGADTSIKFETDK